MSILFDQVYELMELSFPPSEFRTRRDQAALLDDPRYRLLPVRHEDGALAGFMAVWELETFRFVEHLAVHPRLRGQRIGERLLTGYIGEAGGGPVVLEVEPPEGEWPERRVRFYERLGFVLNSYPYVQPPLREGQAPLPLMLMSYSAPLAEPDYLRFRDSVYRHVYRQPAKM
ncbi:GNAT family N-acetyltransferase [Paenibacillus glufosinatiresistens]|uniref:GNAT family N-acetyltransferase n=1 Tax=Paenibacillus glufosinatiresistens TaxID=3070657 RepID=UPI00286D924F|nr:GNAT family N-acetyltransferase [Paenibacillus sp. YX.27]